jgi:hypothetical protein
MSFRFVETGHALSLRLCGIKCRAATFIDTNCQFTGKYFS